MMAQALSIVAPIPFNIVFYSINKGKLRINVLDLSRFYVPLGHVRTAKSRTFSLFLSLSISLSAYLPLFIFDIVQLALLKAFYAHCKCLVRNPQPFMYTVK